MRVFSVTAAGILVATSVVSATFHPTHLGDGGPSTFAYATWSDILKNQTCSQNSKPMAITLNATSPSEKPGILECSLIAGIKTYQFPAGIFEIGEQLLVPEKTTIIGNQNPNNMDRPEVSPDWDQQTLFLATRGVFSFQDAYCYASDMVTTRVGFVLSSDVTVSNLSYQGIDTIRPNDNGALCGGGAFETKGCAQNDCGGTVNNGGSDGKASVNVKIENVRINDYYFAIDEPLIGATIEGNQKCSTGRRVSSSEHSHMPVVGNEDLSCCFCQPNGVRASQVAVWVPETRDRNDGNWTENLLIQNLVSRSTQADGINLHGNVRHALVNHAWITNTGDDGFALWGGGDAPYNVTFANCELHDPGIVRPNWYGNCFATYGLQNLTIQNAICYARIDPYAIPMRFFDNCVMIDTSMFVFFGTFSAYYPDDNLVTIDNFKFQNLDGLQYTIENGTTTSPQWGVVPANMTWTMNEHSGKYEPYYFFQPPSNTINVNFL